MKIATIVAAVALATGGAAFAADHSSYDQPDTSRHAVTRAHEDAHEAGHDAKASGHDFMSRTRAALHRMGEKLRNATHHDRTATASDKDRNDTRAMGAAGESHDSTRQHRMDSAYGDYHNKHDSDKR
jgi:hypothetical protein